MPMCLLRNEGDSDRFTWGIQVLSAEDFSPFDALSLQNYEKRFAFFTRIV